MLPALNAAPAEARCRICGSKSPKVFEAMLMARHFVAYYHCGECGFLQTETPYWLDAAYAEPINLSDTGILARNFRTCRLVSAVINSFFPRDGRCLDFAGGYGLFVRLMRDEGFDFLWQDPYTQNLFARGFERRPGHGEPIALITSFESFEHFVDPRAELGKMLETSRNILFTTELLPRPLPRPGDWWYYGLEHGQHISFYSEKTLAWMARKHGLNFLSAGGLHCFTERAINPLLYRLMLRLARMEIRPGSWLGKKVRSRTFEDMIAVSRSLDGGSRENGRLAPGTSV